MTITTDADRDVSHLTAPHDPLWVPLLSHYLRGTPGRIDTGRTAAQARFLQAHLHQFLIAGSTGDGWELDDTAMADLVILACDPSVFGPDTRLLFGALRQRTEEVIVRARAIEDLLDRHQTRAAEVVGLAICPPVDASASQATIERHYERVLAATSLPIAVYQLPQVTGCAIEPETMRRIAVDRRIVSLKDSSGTDTIANSGAANGILALRGAEGGYAEAVAPHGPYDGWLLSSGNAIPSELRLLAEEISLGHDQASRALSAEISVVVQQIFEAVWSLPFGNAFSNANRSADHLLAWGASWRNAELPVTVSGDTIPREIIETVGSVLERAGRVPGVGYMRED